MAARDHASITASGCKLVGPAPGRFSDITSAAEAETHATVTLVSADILCVWPSELKQLLLRVEDRWYAQPTGFIATYN
jgi:hypothetical protein